MSLMWAKLDDAEGLNEPVRFNGYHTSGITAQLRSENVPYVVVTPQIASMTETLPYYDMMLGKVSSLEPLIAKLAKLNH